jgi:ABC-2 type transport system permease protein
MIPLLAVAIPLIVVTNLFLGVSPAMMVIALLTMIGITCAFTGMALALGAIYPNYETENPAEIPTSFGGLLFMMSAVIYLGLVIVLEAWPMSRFLEARLNGVDFGEAGAMTVVAGIGGAALLTTLVVSISLRAGARRIRESEIFIGEGA